MTNVRPLTPKQEDRRHRILSATRAMVADHGYEGMVMSQVAETAGVSPTTLYNLYNTKDELLLEALRELVVDGYQAMPQDAPGWRYIVQVARGGALLRLREPAYGEAITDALMRASAGDALVELLLSSVRQDFLHSLKKMEERGELLSDVDVQQTATILLANYWAPFFLLNKGVEKISQIETSLRINLLSVLIGVATPEVRKEMDVVMAELRKS